FRSQLIQPLFPHFSVSPAYGLGVLKTCLRLAQRKWGALPEALSARMEALEYSQLERLAEDLLDLRSLEDLTAWLEKAGR
ncbi:MAG: DUF4351 domain-containing protein, partial [Prosthecobacter sp.]|nr:DUF4351 domain-containing protein [Prosthecobacter sp.]